MMYNKNIERGYIMKKDTSNVFGLPTSNVKSKFLHFGDDKTDYNWMALLICILNEKYTVTDSLVAMGVINTREDFEGDDYNING